MPKRVTSQAVFERALNVNMDFKWWLGVFFFFLEKIIFSP
jgi:hypothetical protein